MAHGNQILEWGIPKGPLVGLALNIVKRNNFSDEVAGRLIRNLVATPKTHVDGILGELAKAILEQEENKLAKMYLEDKTCPLTIYGQNMIEPDAIKQMQDVCRIPVAIKGALMPDAHLGYTMPIGGVVAFNKAVSPSCVGVDIGCRMHLSITDIPFKEIKGEKDRLAKIVQDNTIFGIGNEGAPYKNHPVLDDERFQDIDIQGLREKAIAQLGSSGGGNHFVDLGYVIMGDEEPMLAILSHSGSRGVGANIADFYTKRAMEKCILPKEARHLAWMGLDTDDGMAYWNAMNLAGEFAKANHEVLHSRIKKALKAKAIRTIQNHHNFAWKEQLSDGQEVIVHRKGATPAGAGDIGIIPGSMTTPSYIVEGLGNEASINSSSHGAGRLMSRKQAKEVNTMSSMRKDLENQGVMLIGGGLDECSAAYKDIREVIQEQKDLVKVIGEFTPWIVRMAEEQAKPWEKKKKK